MADLNRAYQEQLQKGLGTYTGPKTKGGEVFEGISSFLKPSVDFLKSTGIAGQQIGAAMNPEPGVSNTRYGPLEMLAIKGAQYLNAPSSGLLEEIEKEQKLADARREASLRMPMPDGIGRPMEIQEQMDIFQTLNPDAGTMTTKQINELSKELSKDKNLKPFPVQPKKKELKPFPKEQAEQNVADANREASLDMPSMSDDPAEQLFAQAMTDYISQAREGAEGQLPKVGDIEAYKKKFAEATGIDISGKPDTSQALMAMGLSMMQNRAGKGFNVGRMLSSVGEAGEKALPALTAAKAEARNNVIAAGKYALEAESSDKTKREAAKKEMSALSQYFVVPKGDGVAGTVSSILQNKGSLETLSKGELQQLMQNPEFAEKFDILPGSSYTKVVEEALKTKEGKDLYLTKSPKDINLFGQGDEAASDVFNIRLFSANPNTNAGGKELYDGDGVRQYKALALAARDLEIAREKFAKGFGLTEGVNVLSFTLDKAESLASAFGIDVSGGANDTEKLELFLVKLQAQNAKAILGEAGKTISDADRALVASIVGNVGVLSNKGQLQEKLNQLYNEIIVKKERQIMDAISTLDYHTNRNVAGRISEGSLETEEEKAELMAYLDGFNKRVS